MVADSETCAPAGASRLARRALFAFTLVFIASRTLVFLIMARRIPNMYFFLRGTHVHHLNYGIFLLAGVGAYLLLRRPGGRALDGAALVYGVALALTFDELGMWLHLGGGYWQRASIDAVVVIAALLGLIAFAADLRRFEARHIRAAVAMLMALAIFAVAMCDASVKIGRVEGPKLEALEAASSP